ncbi:MAG TPA: Mth938-like domain-containing protein [Burkholderiales bacterium]
MKLHASSPSALNTFSGYGEGFVLVNGQRHEQNLIVMPEQLLPWSAASFDALKEEDFRVFLELNLEILLLGTGPKQRFPHPRLTGALAAQRVGVEAMDLQAACRTYNILMAEQRRVAAALLFS